MVLKRDAAWFLAASWLVFPVWAACRHAWMHMAGYLPILSELATFATLAVGWAVSAYLAGEGGARACRDPERSRAARALAVGASVASAFAAFPLGLYLYMVILRAVVRPACAMR